MSSPTDTTKPAPGSSGHKDDSQSGQQPTRKQAASPNSPARNRSQHDRKRSTSRGNGGASSPTNERKPQNQQGGGGGAGGSHGRRSSRGGGHAGNGGGASGRRSSGGGHGGSSGGQQHHRRESQQNDGLANLQNVISDMPPPTGGPARSSSSQPSSPARQRSQPGGGHRKNPSGPSVPSISAPPPSLPPTANTLNPTAGGFQPGMLGPIHDMIDEGLVTPTASRFDLMTGMPRSPTAPSTLPDAGTGFGGVAALNQSALVFPPPQPATQGLGISNQQQQALALQQQQFQLAQLAAGMNPALAGTGGSLNEASELIAEQLAIQQQLENLRLQQESLMARFGDMQATLTGQGAPPVSAPPSSGPSGQHRRVSSSSGHQHQPSGAMGSFGLPGGVGAAAGQPQLPKGHGRRHSVQTGKTAPGGANGSTSAPSGNGGFGTGFQFPPRPQGQQQGTPTQQPRFLEEDPFASGNDSPSGGRTMGHHRRQSGSVSSLGGWSMNMSQSSTNNLAEAQAHLQALGAYRASSGHARVPSFGMSAIGPGGQGGPGQLAMAGYGGGIPQPGMGGPNGQNQMRKTLFAPYLPQASIPPLLAAGKLVIGTLRVNKRNRSDAYVATDVLDADIYICGSKDRNRALEGDIVAVELLDVDEVWGTKKDKEEKKRRKEEQASYDPKTARDLRKQDKKKDDVEVEGQGLLLFEDEEVTDETKPQFAGHVVAVLERAPGQLFSGMLGVLRPSSAATQQKQDAERREREGVDLRGGQGQSNGSSQPPPKIIWFRPTDKRVPLIAIPTEQAPADFVEHSEKYSDRLFVACIKRWPITSLHPFGQLVEELGPIGDIETETNALLKDCNFTAEDFSDSVNKCLPPTPWSIPERELQPDVRRDLRDKRVFTIDPETAKDLDDALHIIQNEDGTFEVGVHIADVSHFVKPNTPLDREARKRATTVYLVQRAVPMLPPTLSEELCSLNAGSDKLTFSVIFTLTPEGQIVSTWFGKTVINSKVKLAYSDAQHVIDNGTLPEGKIADAELREGVETDVKRLAGIAKHLRHRRFDSGALRIDNVKVSFRLDEFGLPVDAHEYVRKEANELIEEFMLMANIAVAGKIASGLPDQSLLRRHEEPIDRRLDAFVQRMRRLGLDIDGSSSHALMDSIVKITDPGERLTLQHLSTRSMQRAKYFCTGMLDISKYRHYALNVPLYTHFTSPIRRYADVIVHRQLEAVLAAQAAAASAEAPMEAKFSLDAEAVSKIAQTCNVKKEAARLAQEQSQHLFLCVLIDDLTKRYGPVIRYGTVIGVLDQAFDVLVSEFGVEKRVHVDQMPVESTVYDERENSLQIFWKKGVDVLTWLAESNQDEHLKRLRAHAHHHSKMMEADSGKGEAESRLFDDDEEEEEGEIKQERRVLETAQHKKSRDRTPLKFQNLNTDHGHCAQTVKTLDVVPVIVSADTTKSPPVLRVVAVSPFA
ncbi:Translational repressor [Rhodotorula toruloides]